MTARFWFRVHRLVNRLAWRFARPAGPVWGSALRIDRTRLLWRLNQFCADRWVEDYVNRKRKGAA